MCEKTMHRVKGEYWRCMCVREMFKSWKHEPGSRWDWRYSEDETRRVEDPQLVGAQIGDGPDVLLSGPHVALQVARRTLPQSGVVDTVLTTRVQRERYREREREREKAMTLKQYHIIIAETLNTVLYSSVMTIIHISLFTGLSLECSNYGEIQT